MKHPVKIKSITSITHDVIAITAEKPAHLNYKPGQAVDVSINNPKWQDELRPFTFTSLPKDDNIQFTIKTYPDHHGVTAQMLELQPEDELIIHEPFGAIGYKGKGIFIAGGAGVTPFIAIFKQLEKENKIEGNTLIFANKTKADIIEADRFNELLGKHFINVLSQETLKGYEHGYITEDLIAQHISDQEDYFYLCGPGPMMDAVDKQLANLGIDKEHIVKEAF